MVIVVVVVVSSHHYAGHVIAVNAQHQCYVCLFVCFVGDMLKETHQQWRSQYGANGALAPPGLPRTISANRANPIRFFGG